MSQYKIYIALLIMLLLSACNHSQKDEQKNTATQSQLAQQIQQCSRIYSSEFEVSKIIVRRDEKRVQGKLVGIDVDIPLAGGERVIAIPIRGVLKGYVDMADFKPENLRIHEDSIQVILPDPKIELTSTKVSASEIREKVEFFQSDFSDRELKQIQKQGRDSLIASIPKLGLIGNIRQNAARNIITLLTSLGYDESKITVTFISSDVQMSTPQRLRDMVIGSIN